MQRSDTKRSGGRVFRIDRECYIVYVGSDHHHVRPFLRVGTSPDIPDRIRQYIGTVVITDRLTGDPTQESTTVGPSVPRKPDYTGSHELIRSAQPFFGAKRISERPIDAARDDTVEGAFVEFLTDGTLNVMVNGHRVFDLTRRERDDRHAAYQLDRIATAVDSASGRYRAEAFEPPGFLVTADRSLFFFRDGEIEARALRPKGIRSFVERLVPISLLRRFSGPVDTDGFLTLAKWAVRDAASNGGADRPFRLITSDRLPGKLAPLVDLLRAAGLAIEVAPMDAAFVDLPSPASDVPGVSLAVGRTVEWPQSGAITVPADAEWAGGVAPPLLPGVPYRLRSSADEVEADDGTLESLAADDSGAHGRLARGLSAWNDAGVASADHAELARDVEQLLGEAPIPVLADIYPTDVGYTVRFMVQHGFSLGDVADNRRAVSRIGAIAAEGVDEAFFLDERRRLLEFLDELLRQRRATVRKETPPAPKRDDTATQASPRTTVASPGATDDTSSGVAAADATVSATPPGVRAPGTGASGRSRTAPSRRLGPLPVAVAIGLFLLLAGGGGYWVFRDRLAGAAPASDVIAARPDGESGPDADARNGDAAVEPGAQNIENDRAGEPASGQRAGDGSPSLDPSQGDGTTTGSDSSSDTTVDRANGDRTSTAEDAGTLDTPGGVDGQAPTEASPTVVAPRDASRDDAESPMLDVELEITALDILILVNEIAVGNDYAPIGDIPTVAPSPDWIYPGNVFAMPDGASYRVERGDTLWGIAETFIRRSMGYNHGKLTDIAHRIDRGERPIDELEALIGAAHSESIRREARELIRQLGV